MHMRFFLPSNGMCLTLCSYDIDVQMLPAKAKKTKTVQVINDISCSLVEFKISVSQKQQRQTNCLSLESADELGRPSGLYH